MALSKIDIANMVTGATPVANGGTGQTTLAAAGLAKRPSTKPIILNGDMAVSQRGTSFSPSGAGTVYTLDRYAYEVTGSGTGDATITQESDAPASTNLRKSLKISPDATETLSSGENIAFTTAMEGQDVQVLGHGTSSPPKATLSFWVKSSKTGTYCVQIKEETISDESYLLFEYSISSANTWEQKILTWTGNTAHTLNSDNTMGFRIVWHLVVHSDDHASATTSWTEATAFKATSNQVDFFDSTSNNWYLTGVQLEVGEFTSATIPPFQHEVFTDNLKRCQRYFETTFDYGTAIGASTSVGMIRSGGNQGGRTSGRMGHSHTYHTLKRAVPTVTFYDNSGNSGACARIDQGSGTGSNKNMGVATGARTNVQVTSTGDSTADVMAYHFTAVAEL